jgi:hypothetical protein
LPKGISEILYRLERPGLTCDENKPNATHRLNTAAGGRPCETERRFNIVATLSRCKVKSSHLEAADIVRPKGESGAGQAETSSKRLGHGLVGRLAIASPVDGETLPSSGSGSRKDGSTVFAESVLEGGEDEVVEDLSVVAGSQTRVSTSSMLSRYHWAASSHLCILLRRRSSESALVVAIDHHLPLLTEDHCRRSMSPLPCAESSLQSRSTGETSSG